MKDKTGMNHRRAELLSQPREPKIEENVVDGLDNAPAVPHDQIGCLASCHVGAGAGNPALHGAKLPPSDGSDRDAQRSATWIVRVHVELQQFQLAQRKLGSRQEYREVVCQFHIVFEDQGRRRVGLSKEPVERIQMADKTGRGPEIEIALSSPAVHVHDWREVFERRVLPVERGYADRFDAQTIELTGDACPAVGTPIQVDDKCRDRHHKRARKIADVIIDDCTAADHQNLRRERVMKRIIVAGILAALIALPSATSAQSRDDIMTWVIEPCISSVGTEPYELSAGAALMADNGLSSSRAFMSEDG